MAFKVVGVLSEQDYLFDKDAHARYFVAYDTKEFNDYQKIAHKGRPRKDKEKENE